MRAAAALHFRQAASPNGLLRQTGCFAKRAHIAADREERRPPARRAQSFWSRLAGKYGSKFFWQDNGEDMAIVNAVRACVRVRAFFWASAAAWLRWALAPACRRPALAPAAQVAAIDNCVREPMGPRQCGSILGELE